MTFGSVLLSSVVLASLIQTHANAFASFARKR
jgi:hypothetical protein